MAGRILLRPMYGLGNRLRAVDAGYVLARETGRRLCVYWCRNEECAASWRELMDIPNDVTVEDVVECDTEWQRIFSRKNKNYFPFDRKSGIGRDFISVCRSREVESIAIDAFRRFYGESDYSWFKPTQSITDEVGRTRRQMGNNLIGLHMRRTDMYIASYLSHTGVFEEKVRAELAKNPDAKFFLATDSSAEQIHLKSLFPNAIFSRESVVSRYSPGDVHDAMVDMLLLASCQKIYGSVSTSFSDEAANIGKITKYKLFDKTRKALTAVVRMQPGKADAERCLASFRNQWLKSVQVICVDTGSDDETTAVVSRYMSADSSFCIARSNDEAMRMAVGKYMCLMSTHTSANYNFSKTVFNVAERTQARQVIVPQGPFQGRSASKDLLRRLNGRIDRRAIWRLMGGKVVSGLVAWIAFYRCRSGALKPYIRVVRREDVCKAGLHILECHSYMSGGAFVVGTSLTENFASEESRPRLNLEERMCRRCYVHPCIVKLASFIIAILKALGKRR